VTPGPDAAERGLGAGSGPAPSRVRVVAAVIEREGRYLVGQRPHDKRHGGLWEFPGGKLDPGETLAEAAARELHEELAVEVAATGAARFESHDPGSPFVIHFVEVRITGEPRAIEHAAIGWFTPAELTALDLAPSDATFVRACLAGDGAPGR